MGIAIDVLVVLFLVWSVVRGWKLGLLYQIGYLALMIVAYFAARGLAALLDRPIADALKTGTIVGGTIAFFASFALLMIVGALVVRRMTRDLIPRDTALSTLNRVLGSAAAGAKGALIVWVTLVLLLQIQHLTGKINLPFESSVAGRFASSHNFLETGALGAVSNLAWVVGTRDRAELASDPDVQRLLQDPKTVALLQSPTVMSAINSQDYVAIIEDKSVQAFLGDPSIQAQLAAIREHHR